MYFFVFSSSALWPSGSKISSRTVKRIQSKVFNLRNFPSLIHRRLGTVFNQLKRGGLKTIKPPGENRYFLFSKTAFHISNRGIVPTSVSKCASKIHSAAFFLPHFLMLKMRKER